MGGGGPSTTGRKDLLSPVLCGFGRSRPEQRSEPEVYAHPKTVEARNIELDVYQHPAKRDCQFLKYTRGYDVYS